MSTPEGNSQHRKSENRVMTRFLFVFIPIAAGVMLMNQGHDLAGLVLFVWGITGI